MASPSPLSTVDVVFDVTDYVVGETPVKIRISLMRSFSHPTAFPARQHLRIITGRSTDTVKTVYDLLQFDLTLPDHLRIILRGKPVCFDSVLDEIGLGDIHFPWVLIPRMLGGSTSFQSLSCEIGQTDF